MVYPVSTTQLGIKLPLNYGDPSGQLPWETTAHLSNFKSNSNRIKSKVGLFSYYNANSHNSSSDLGDNCPGDNCSRHLYINQPYQVEFLWDEKVGLLSFYNSTRNRASTDWEDQSPSDKCPWTQLHITFSFQIVFEIK